MPGKQILWERHIPTLPAVLILLIVVGISYGLLLPIESGDARLWFVPWVRYIIEHGPQAALAKSLPILVPEANGVGNYTPAYLYLLIVGNAVGSFLGPLGVVKLVSVLSAVICAACMFVLLRTLVPDRRAAFGAAATLLLPTVGLNAAAWGQIDCLYAAATLLAVAAALRGWCVAMMVAFGIAVSIKLQAAFIGPFLLYVLIVEGAPLWVALVPVLCYALVMSPAWLAGRPAIELAMIYPDQAHAYQWLSMNAPNPWTFVQFFKLMPNQTGLLLGLLLGAGAGLALASLALRKRLRGPDLLLLALTSTTVLPYVLPKMAERYFMLAELLSLALAIVRPRVSSIVAAVLIQLGSSGAYLTHFTGYRAGTGLGVLLVGAGLFLIVRDLIEAVGPRRVVEPAIE